MAAKQTRTRYAEVKKKRQQCLVKIIKLKGVMQEIFALQSQKRRGFVYPLKVLL